MGKDEQDTMTMAIDADKQGLERNVEDDTRMASFAESEKLESHLEDKRLDMDREDDRDISIHAGAHSLWLMDATVIVVDLETGLHSGNEIVMMSSSPASSSDIIDVHSEPFSTTISSP